LLDVEIVIVPQRIPHILGGFTVNTPANHGGAWIGEKFLVEGHGGGRRE
jgi:hypothetical protein